MSNTDKLTQVGQYVIEDCTITSSNQQQFQAKDIVIGIQFFEDIYSSFASGYLIIRDGLGMVETLPLRGEETVYLKIKTPTLNEPYQMIDELFYMYSMTGRPDVSKKTEDYIIGFCSKESLMAKLFRVQTGFSDYGHNIAQALIKSSNYIETSKPVTIEPTITYMNYVSNFWTIEQNLKYISTMCSNDNNVNGYTFFENRYGINLISLDSLFKYSPTYQKFYYDEYTTSVDGINIDKMYQSVSSMEIIGNYDYIRDMQNGMLSSVDFSYDSVRKNYTANVFNYQDSFIETNHLNDTSLYSNGAVIPLYGKIIQRPRAYDNFNNGDQSGFGQLQQRASILNTLNARRLKIVVPGRFDYTVGQIAEFEAYTTRPLTKNDANAIDKSISGKYVISALQHVLTMTNHTCVIELSTDTTELPL